MPASAVDSVMLPDSALSEASGKMVERDYKGAVESALKAPESGMRDFLIGMAKCRSSEWENSAEYLAKASGSFHLLADYAMLNQAYALSRLARYPESLSILQLLTKSYPDSPLIRSADKLLADTLFDSGNFRAALDAYQNFIEKHPSGADSLDSLYKIARCKEQTGEISSAINSLRRIWLKYPASSVAEKADTDLRRLNNNGGTAQSFTPEEMMGRGTVLFDLGRYDKAEETFCAIPQENLNDDLRCRLMLKIGQSRLKARKYSGAEQTFRLLIARSPRDGIADEARYWLAKTLDKCGSDDEAYSSYIKLANISPRSTLADDALLAAYFIRKFQNKGGDALDLLKKLESDYPRSSLLQTAYWEIAWQCYEKGDFKTAANYFRKILNDKNRREKTLFWYSRTLAATGDKTGADKVVTALITEYPFGYYALTLGKDKAAQAQEAYLQGDDLQYITPEPAGYERAKTLINLGLYDEAGKELNWSKRRNPNDTAVLSAIARLYLQMDDFHGASTIIPPEHLGAMGKNSSADWGMAYPRAYREHVADNAAENRLEEILIYSIMRAESNYSPDAVSPSGAIGLMQIMPATASAISSVKNGSGNGNRERLRTPAINIRLGVKHMRDLLDLYGGDLVLAVAAYNAGAGNVNRWVKRLGNLTRDLFIENIPFPETREYVKKVLAGIEIYKRIYKIAPLKLPETQTTFPNGQGPAPDIPERKTSLDKS